MTENTSACPIHGCGARLTVQPGEEIETLADHLYDHSARTLATHLAELVIRTPDDHPDQNKYRITLGATDGWDIWHGDTWIGCINDQNTCFGHDRYAARTSKERSQMDAGCHTTFEEAIAAIIQAHKQEKP